MFCKYNDKARRTFHLLFFLSWSEFYFPFNCFHLLCTFAKKYFQSQKIYYFFFFSFSIQRPDLVTKISRREKQKVQTPSSSKSLLIKKAQSALNLIPLLSQSFPTCAILPTCAKKVWIFYFGFSNIMVICMNEANIKAHKFYKGGTCRSSHKSIKKITCCNDFYDLKIIR